MHGPDCDCLNESNILVYYEAIRALAIKLNLTPLEVLTGTALIQGETIAALEDLISAPEADEVQANLLRSIPAVRAYFTNRRHGLNDMEASILLPLDLSKGKKVN